MNDKIQLPSPSELLLYHAWCGTPAPEAAELAWPDLIRRGLALKTDSGYSLTKEGRYQALLRWPGAGR